MHLRPYAAAFFAFFLGSWIGCFYLGRGWLGLAYIAATIAVLGFSLWLLGEPELPLLALALTSAAHCFYLARKDGKTPPRPWYSRWYALAGLAIAPFAVLLPLRMFVFDLNSMVAKSMSPTINIGDRIHVSRLAYTAGATPRRGDVVTFRHDGNVWIKRVVGLPGDAVQYIDGELYLNGRKQPRTRIEDFVVDAEDGKAYPSYLETLDDGRSYAIVDIMPNGFYDNTPVYTVPEKSYFMLGDNRDNSTDSRVLSAVGYIAEEDLIGRALFVFGSSGIRSLN